MPRKGAEHNGLFDVVPEEIDREGAVPVLRVAVIPQVLVDRSWFVVPRHFVVLAKSSKL